MDKNRAPWSLKILTTAAILLGVSMTWDGLVACITGDLFSSAGIFGASRGVLTTALSSPLAGMTGIGAVQLGWLYLVTGLSWVGTLVSLWIRQRWALSVCLVVALLSFTYPGFGWILTVIILVLLYLPTTRRWLQS